MNRLQQALVWLSRIGHCRGFGIQSPTDYRFVRYVVNEHCPYYAYEQLGRDDHWQRRKLGRLYFRLANELQPPLVADLVGYADYLQAGCRRARISQELSAEAALIIAPPTASAESLLQAARPGTMLVVEDIGRRPGCWTAIAAQPQATVTYDLYYCGIAICLPQRTKQHYIVNF